MNRVLFAVAPMLLAAGCAVEPAKPAPDSGAPRAATEPVPNRPKVPGKLRLTRRERKETAPGSKQFKPVEKTGEWAVAETAVIICDMWDDHYCKSAAQRVSAMVPRMTLSIRARSSPSRGRRGGRTCSGAP